VDGLRMIASNARIVAATNRNLEAAIDKETLRYRMEKHQLHPPARNGSLRSKAIGNFVRGRLSGGSFARGPMHH
jgi:hypothetical protein